MLNALTFLTDLGYYDSDISSKIVSGLAAGFGVSSLLISLIIFILSIIGLWKIFDKAGVPGWYSLIPIANTYQLTKIATGNGWLFLLMLIPGLGLLAWYILIAVKLADAFGKGVGFKIGIFLVAPIMYMILGLGDAQYIGPQ